MRILLVTPSSPFGRGYGGQQRSALLYRALSTLGNVEVVVAHEAAEYAAERSGHSEVAVTATWRDHVLPTTRFAPDPRLTELIQSHLDLRRYDCVCGRYLRTVSRLDVPRDVPVVVDLDDIGFTYAGSYLSLSGTAARLKTRLRRPLERRAMRRFRDFWFLSQRDRARFPDMPGSVLPNVPHIEGSVAESGPTSRQILFVGALWYPPNRDAVEWFLRECWTEIRRRSETATFLIAGNGPSPLRERWASLPGVEAPGFVPDLVDAYARSALCIAPIFAGGGTSIKVLEALGYGRPVATTSFVAAAFAPDLVPGRHIFVRDTPQGFSELVLELLEDPVLRRTAGEEGARVVAEKFSPEGFTATVRDTILAL